MGGTVEQYHKIFAEHERYADGVSADYPTLIRMWSALNRSVAAFNQDCGIITLRPLGGDKKRGRTDKSEPK